MSIPATAHAGSTPQQREHATTIFEKGAPGRRAFRAPALDVPPVDGLIPDGLRRAQPPRLPEASEPEIVRHYVNLSKRNFDLDSGFYPLGSCTMKHNPRLHERVAALPGHARLHPLQHPRRAQGALELMYNLQEALAEIAGLPHVSLQPSAGSHGELAGVLLTRAYHADRGEQRTKVLTPDSAHGTNPATVTMAGYEVVKVALDARRRRRSRRPAREDRRVASPASCSRTRARWGSSTPTSRRWRAIVHEVGATLYYDGANLNAIMGYSRPGDMGFDIVHFNLHKTFTQPHGGGGPGCRPDRGVRSHRAVPAAPAGRAPRAGAPNGEQASAEGEANGRWSAARRSTTSTRTGRSRSASCAAFRATTACSCARTPISARWARRG